MKSARVENMFSDAMKEIRDASKESVTQIADQAMQTVQEATMEVDRAAHRSPWYFVGATAAAAAVVGFVAGRKSKS